MGPQLSKVDHSQPLPSVELLSSHVLLTLSGWFLVVSLERFSPFLSSIAPSLGLL